MSFAAPGFLGLLALAPLVVYLHMRRHRSTLVPSTVVWRLVAEVAEPRPRVRPVPSSLSLWLQLATVVLAALALAEPRVGARDPTHHVLVLDAGMFTGIKVPGSDETAYEVAWRGWLERTSSAVGNDLYSVWWVGPWTRPLALELRSPAAVRRALEATSHADAPADWRAAAEALASFDLGTASVTVFASHVAAAEEALEGLDLGSVELAGMTQPDVNVTLSDVSVELADASAQRWSIEAVARITGQLAAPGEGVTFRVTFLPDGASVPLPYVERNVRLNIGGSARLSEELTLPGRGIVEVSVSSGDLLASDDTARFRLDPAPMRPRAVVVTSLGDVSPAARAISATGRFVVEVVETLPQGAAAGLIVLEKVAYAFEEATIEAPAVLVLGTGPGPEARPGVEPGLAQVVRWDRDHPASSGTDWAATSGARALAVGPLGEVLVEGADGPLLVARTTRTSREVIAGYDPSDSAFVERDEFVTFMVDVLEWLVPPAAEVSACTVGLPCRVSWSAVASGFEARLEGAPVWRQPPPAGAVVPSRLDEAWVPIRAGLWTLTATGGASFAVPVNPRTEVREEAGQSGSASEAGPARTRFSLPWRGIPSLLLLAAAALIVVEGLSAGRAPLGYWRPDSLRAPGSTGRRSRRTAALHVVAVVASGAAVAAAPLVLPSAANWLVVIGAGLDSLGSAQWERARTSTVDLRNENGSVNLERALAEAAARVDPRLTLDVVVASGHEATGGDTIRGIGPLLDRDATVHVVDTPPAPERVDVVAADLMFSDTHFKGDSLRVTALVHSAAIVPADLRVLFAGQLVEEWEVELQPGWSSFTTTVDLQAEGTLPLVLEVTAEGDEIAGNDRRMELLEVRGGPTVTVFASDLDRGQALATALELQGMVVQVKGPHTVPSQPSAFAGNDAVVLMDVPAIDLARSQQDALEAWVKEHGGGLALLGGERSFGPGGYLETPLDSLSPLSAKVSREAPAVAMLFVLDRSGSMQQVVDGVSRLDIAKEATLAANELLGGGSEIAVVVFDEQARVLLPFTDSAERDAIDAALARLVPGGGTALYPGLVLAAEVLATTDASSKHVVVMTDGLSRPGDIESAVERLVAMDATVSAIAIGVGADVERVRNIARIGQGTAHTTADFRALPSILAQEAMLLSGDPVVREPAVPRRASGAASPMEGLPDEFPVLDAFVETTPKAAATVLIEDGEGRPILGAWRYGAGRVIAYTSQGVGPWSSAWSESEDFATWWAQWLRWVVQPSRPIGVDVQATVIDDEVRVDVFASDERGAPVTGLQLTAAASPLGEGDPSERLGPVSLAEVAPGQYRGRFAASHGTWRVTVTDLSGAMEIGDTTLVSWSYPSAIGAPRPNDAVLHGLVDLTGGRRLDGTEAWRPGNASVWAVSRAWRPWLVLAMAVWTLFLVQRYAPAWLTPPRLRSRRARAATAIGTRTTALRVR